MGDFQMRCVLRVGAIALALLGTVGLAAANEVADLTLPGLSVMDWTSLAADLPLGPTFPDDETTGSIDRTAGTPSLPLSDEQLGWVFLGVMNLPDVPESDIAVPKALVALPDGVELQELPAMVTLRIPLLREHKFVKLDDRILLVRPVDRMVVSVIPRYRILP
jgi:hypothetical protein